MKLLLRKFIHRAQLVMQLDLKTDASIAKKILQLKPVVSPQHFIAGGPTDEAIVTILDAKVPVKEIKGKWSFHHTVNERYGCINYLLFTPDCDVKAFVLETVDKITDKYYLYSTFKNYKKL